MNAKNARKTFAWGAAPTVCGLLAAACIGLPAWSAYAAHRAAAEDNVRSALASSLRAGEEALRWWVRERVLSAERVWLEHRASSPPDWVALRAAAERSGFSGATWIENGRTVYSRDRRTGVAPITGFTLAADGRPVVWTAPAKPDRPSAAVVVIRPPERPEAALLLHIDPAFDAASRLRSIGDGGLELRPLNGAVLDEGGCEWAWNAPPATPEAFDLTGTATRCGEPVAAGRVIVPELGAALLASRPFAEAFGSSRRLAAWIAVLVLALAAGVVFFVSSQTGATPVKADPPRTRRRKNAAAWGILAVALIATLAAWMLTRRRIGEYEQHRFENAVDLLRLEITERFSQVAQTLSLAAETRASAANDAELWESLVNAMRLPTRQPALRSLGWVEASFGPADAGAPGAVALTTTCLWESPRELSETAGGECVFTRLSTAGALEDPPLDMSAGALRVRLVGSASKPRYLMLRAMRSGEGRQARRWAAALVEPAELFDALPLNSDPPLRFAVFASPEPTSESAAYDSGPGFERPLTAAGFDAARPFLVGESEWSLAASAISPSAGAGIDRDYPAQVLLAGLAISVLLFDIALVLSSTRERALSIAELMTRKYREGEERVRAVIDHAPDGIITFTAQGRVLTFNPGAEKLFEQALEEGTSPRLTDLIPGLTPTEAERMARRGGQGEERVARRRDGEEFPAEITVSAMRVDERSLFTAVIRDVSARRRAEERLRESEERYALAARGANDGLWDWDLRRNRIYFSPRWKAMLGAADAEIQDRPEDWFDRVHPDDRETFRRKLDEHLSGATPHFECEHRVRHQSGEYRWMLSRGIAVRSAGGEAARVAGSQTDITERKRAEQKLRHDALHDALTGLPNRAFFMGEVERARRETAAGGRLFGLFFMDIDRFKLVNDSLGHLVGDRLLAAFAERLRGCIRPGDAICRLGGDEFAVLVRNLQSPADAAQIAERVRREAGRPIRVEGQDLFTAVSIGITLSSSGRETAEDLLRDADAAMYRAKSAGKGRYEFFNASMHENAVAFLRLESDLRRAVERSEFHLLYQPIARLADGQVVACESLTRWHHPARGVIHPKEFIPIAEETGAIAELTRWVLSESCAQRRRWSDQGGFAPPKMSINVSPRHLASEEIAEAVLETLARFELPASALQLELTETALSEHSEGGVPRTLRALDAAGVSIWLDDFGTGYSSLLHLRRFPIAGIKVDRSFIEPLPADAGSAKIVAGLANLARDLGLEVVAEGVETAAQARFLRECGCDYVQGFVVSPALDADELGGRLLRTDFPRF